MVADKSRDNKGAGKLTARLFLRNIHFIPGVRHALFVAVTSPFSSHANSIAFPSSDQQPAPFITLAIVSGKKQDAPVPANAAPSIPVSVPSFAMPFLPIPARSPDRQRS
jgi:hypothetical protein